MEIHLRKDNLGLAAKGLSAAKYTIIYRIAIQGMNVLVIVFIVRLLSAHDYGIYNLLYSIIAMMSVVFSFGIGNTLQRFMPEYYSRGEYVIAHRLYRISAVIRLISNVAVLICVLQFWDLFSFYFKLNGYRTYFFFFCIIILLHLQKGILETCLNSYFLQKYTQLMAAMFTVARGLGYGAGLLLSWNLWHILVVDLIAYVITFFVLEIIYARKIPKTGGSFTKFPAIEKKRLRRYSFFYNFNDAGVGLLQSDFDNFFLAMFMDPAAVGAYAFCNRIIKMSGQLSPVLYLQQVIQPIFFSRNGEETEKFDSFQIVLKFVYLFQIPIFCMFFLFSREIIQVFFDGKYIEYSSVLMLVSLFFLLNSIDFPTGLLAQLHEHADILLYSKCFALYNVLADIILIKYFGVFGAVIATGTATLGKNLFVLYFVRKHTSCHGLPTFFSRLIGYWACVTFFIVITVKSFFIGPLYILLFGCSILAGCFWMQFRYVYLNGKEKFFLRSLESKNRKVSKIFYWSGLAYAMR